MLDAHYFNFWVKFNILHLKHSVIYFCILMAILLSQFTLYGFLKRNEPDFHLSMPPERAKPFYQSIVDRFTKAYDPDSMKVYGFFVFSCLS